MPEHAGGRREPLLLRAHILMGFAPLPFGCFTDEMKYCVLVTLLCSACMADFEWTGSTGVSETGADASDGTGDDAGDCPDSQTVPDWPGCWRIGGRQLSCIETCEPWGPFDAARTRHVGSPIALHFFPRLGVGEPLLAVECVRDDIGITWPATGELPTGGERSNCQPICVCST